LRPQDAEIGVVVLSQHSDPSYGLAFIRLGLNARGARTTRDRDADALAGAGGTGETSSDR
jgi:hypothetical protein